MIAIFDEDGGGDVDFQEFVSGLSAFSSKGNKEEKLKFAFKVYDIDRDGYISNGELFIVLKMMVGSNLKDQQLQQIVDKTIMEADLDRDGKISFEEFQKMVENTDVSMSMTLGMCALLRIGGRCAADHLQINSKRHVEAEGGDTARDARKILLKALHYGYHFMASENEQKAHGTDNGSGSMHVCLGAITTFYHEPNNLTFRQRPNLWWSREQHLIDNSGQRGSNDLHDLSTREGNYRGLNSWIS